MDFEQIIKAAAAEIFSSMIFLELTPGNSINEEKRDLGCHVSAMIGLSGDFNAILGIHCPAHVGMAIGTAMLGTPLVEVDDDTRDALGELTNMLAGGLKDALATQQLNLLLAIPTTISGITYKISSPTASNRVLIPFDLEAGRFYIDFKYSLS